MTKFTEVVHKLVRPYYNYIIVIISVLIFASFGTLFENLTDVKPCPLSSSKTK